MLLSQLSSLSSLVFGFPLESTDTTMIFKAWTNLRIGSGQNVPADDQASPSKAEQRRAQVRKAQIQHRQRKANYVKTLETDAERYREMIATTRREALAIHAENEAIKAQLLQHSLKLSLDQNLFLTEQMASTPSPRNDDHEAYNMLPLEDITMTLGYDDIMNAPCYYISSSPSPSQFGSSVNSLEGSAAPETCSAAPNPHLPEMTPQQIQQAINFILAYVPYFLLFSLLLLIIFLTPLTCPKIVWSTFAATILTPPSFLPPQSSPQQTKTASQAANLDIHSWPHLSPCAAHHLMSFRRPERRNYSREVRSRYVRLHQTRQTQSRGRLRGLLYKVCTDWHARYMGRMMQKSPRYRCGLNS